MADKKAGGIFASSFVAGCLLAAALFSPRAWEPVPGPSFVLAEKTGASSSSEESMEAVHAELSARAQSKFPTASAGIATAEPEADPAFEPVLVEPMPVAAPADLPAVVAGGTQPRSGGVPPERVAMNDATSTAALAVLADAVTAPPPDTATDATAPQEEPPAALKAMMSRLQASRPQFATPPRTAPEVESIVPVPAPRPTSPPPPSPQTWARAFAAAPAVVQDLPRTAAESGERLASDPVATTPQRPAGGPLGVPPLPGEPWSDPDGINWSDVLTSPPSASRPSIEGDRRRDWLGDRRHESRVSPPRIAEHRTSTQPGGTRFIDRLRVGDRRAAPSLVSESGLPALADRAPPDIGRWPRPLKLEQQLENLTTLSTEAGQGCEAITGWSHRTRSTLQGVQDTRGPRDTAAEAGLIALGEAVIAGMSLADTAVDATVATHTRRAALAVARRVALWRSTAALFTSIDLDPQEHGVSDAAAAMTRQGAGRTVLEIARLLDGIERFEATPNAAYAEAVKTSLRSIGTFYPTASRPVARAVEDHYLAPNVRIAVHQQFLEKLLPGASVDTSPFQDTVMGRDVRGTRTVERTTMLRLVPDDDEICFNLEVHGDIASRAVTESGPVSVTARSNSAFTVRKPITISSQGLLFGNASGAASNRSRVDNIQTSFDAVPVMGSLVRTMAKNQQAESMPEANREVIDKIVSRACREVDTQAEPQFALMADRIRDRVWVPLVKLGLDPKAVAMQTTSTVATMRLRLAGETQLAAHTPRPRAPADAMLSLQVHESSVNNAIDRLDVAGKRLPLEELIRHVCGRIGVEPRIPEELPDGVAVTFAKTQPLRVECRDGLVHVQVSLDAIESGRRDWYDLVVHVAYKPVCSGQQVFLEREGPVQLRGPGHEGRMELALRTIFGKIFPKERPIPILPAKIATNEKLAGVQAVQAASSDGWLAITLEERKAPSPAIASPPRSKTPRPAEARRRAVWR